MRTIGFHIADRVGTSATIRWAKLGPEDVGVAVDPSSIAGTPGAKADSLTDLTVSFDGELGSVRGAGRLLGSNDAKNYFPVRDTGGLDVTSDSDGAQHVDGTQFKLYRPEVGPAGVSVTCTIHAKA